MYSVNNNNTHFYIKNGNFVDFFTDPSASAAQKTVSSVIEIGEEVEILLTEYLLFALFF